MFDIIRISKFQFSVFFVYFFNKIFQARHPQLMYESKVYKILQGGVGIPHIRWFVSFANLCPCNIGVLALYISNISHNDLQSFIKTGFKSLF